jgi:bacterioferritin-associated ferredoxin
MSSDESLSAKAVICHCSGTKRDNIQSLFEQGLDMNAISRWTGALSGCGGCEWDIAQFLKELAEQQNGDAPKL